jgi:hypothetical protein
MVVNCVKKTIRKMICRKALERWEMKIENCEVTPQAVWPIAKSLMKRDGPEAPLLFMVLQALSVFR